MKIKYRCSKDLKQSEIIIYKTEFFIQSHCFLGLQNVTIDRRKALDIFMSFLLVFIHQRIKDTHCIK